MGVTQTLLRGTRGQWYLRRLLGSANVTGGRIGSAWTADWRVGRGRVIMATCSTD
jgi:hypothetical protein